MFWMAAIAIPAAFGFYFLSQTQDVEPTDEVATVISFGERPFEDGPRPLMNVRLTNGDEQTVMISSDVLQSCRKGNKVAIHRRGLNVRVAPEACDILVLDQ